MSINIDSVLNRMWKNYDSNKNSSTSTNTNQNSEISENIFAQAEKLVTEYNQKKEEYSTSTTTKSSSYIGGKSFTEIANMSTSDFLKYAYENKANTGFENTKEDSSGIKLPAIVRYKTAVVSTSGKSFMQVVAKLAAKFPRRTETEIAAELISKYGSNETETDTDKNSDSTNSASDSGNKLDMSA